LPSTSRALPAKPEPLKPYLDVRREYLTPPLSTRKLGLREVRRAAGRLGNGDRNDLRLFGMSTVAWYALGIRIVGRTVIEATRDPQAVFLARAVAATLRAGAHEVREVIDPFVGSGNVLYHLVKETRASHGVGIELDPVISRLTTHNFDVMRRRMRLRGTEIRIQAGDWSQSGAFTGEHSTLFYVSPPWGDAFSATGLDLRATEPPIMEILGQIEQSTGDGSVFAAIATFPKVVEESVREVVATYKPLPVLRSNNPNIASRIDYLLVQIR
jgi:hypothetical protein